MICLSCSHDEGEEEDTTSAYDFTADELSFKELVFCSIFKDRVRSVSEIGPKFVWSSFFNTSSLSPILHSSRSLAPRMINLSCSILNVDRSSSVMPIKDCTNLDSLSIYSPSPIKGTLTWREFNFEVCEISLRPDRRPAIINNRI